MLKPYLVNLKDPGHGVPGHCEVKARCQPCIYYFWVQRVSLVLKPFSLLFLFLPFPGYIGGTVLARLLEIKRQSFHITIVVRSADKAAKFNAIPEYNNLVAVVGSLDEVDKMENLAAGVQYVFNCVRDRSIAFIDQRQY